MTNTKNAEHNDDSILAENKPVQNLEDRIEKVESLLQRLEQERKQLEENNPPKPERPMKEHVTDLAERAGLDSEDIIVRTRQTSSGPKKRPSGFNKDGVIKINYYMAELEKELEERSG